MSTGIAVFTFGCRTNQYESQLLREAIVAAGNEVVLPEEASVAIINACCVTGKAEKDCRNLIRRLSRRGLRVVVTGCFLDESLAGLPAETYRRGQLPEELVCASVESISGFAGHLRAFVKVEDGCEGNCAYCIVPKVRGAVRSRRVADVAREVVCLVERGWPEVVLTGVNLAAFGKDTGERLAGLIATVGRINGLRRLRLSSLEPAFFCEDLLSAATDCPCFCPHFHIPLQSGSDRILQAMGREVSAASYLRLVDRVRRALPDATLTTDVIVGFPGETMADVEETCRVIEEAGFLGVHIFPFSMRPGTSAASLPGRVGPEEIRRRTRRVRECAERVRGRILAGMVGSRQEILAESREGSIWRGYTAGYAPAMVEAADASRGDAIPFRVQGVRQNRLVGFREAICRWQAQSSVSCS